MKYEFKSGKSDSQLLLELVWVFLALLLTLLISRIIFGTFQLAGTIDIYMYDSYYIVQRWLLLIPLFFFTTFLLFVIKTNFRILYSPYNKWILLMSGIFLVGSLGILIKKLSQVRTTGWSVYPPVVESGLQHFPVPQSDPISNTLTNFLLLVQLLLLITTVFFAYRLGTSAQKK